MARRGPAAIEGSNVLCEHKDLSPAQNPEGVPLRSADGDESHFMSPSWRLHLAKPSGKEPHDGPLTPTRGPPQSEDHSREASRIAHRWTMGFPGRPRKSRWNRGFSRCCLRKVSPIWRLMIQTGGSSASSITT